MDLFRTYSTYNASMWKIREQGEHTLSNYHQLMWAGFELGWFSWSNWAWVFVKFLPVEIFVHLHISTFEQTSIHWHQTKNLLLPSSTGSIVLDGGISRCSGVTVFGTDDVIQCNMLTVEVNSVSFLCHLNTFGNVTNQVCTLKFLSLCSACSGVGRLK